VVVRNLKTGRETTEPYDALVLSPAPRPSAWNPGADGERIFTLRNMGDMDAILAAVPKDGTGRALVVGAGFIGLELAEQFRLRGLPSPWWRSCPCAGPADPEMTIPLQEELVRQGVDLRLGRSVTAFTEAGGVLEAMLDDGGRIPCALAVLSVGVRPIRAWPGPRASHRSHRGILVDDRMRTSAPNIFAVGDAVEVREFVSGEPALIPLAGPANRQGRIAAEVILGRDSRYKASQGTAICKVFDLAFAMTGLSEAMLERKAWPTAAPTCSRRTMRRTILARVRSC